MAIACRWPVQLRVSLWSVFWGEEHSWLEGCGSMKGTGALRVQGWSPEGASFSHVHLTFLLTESSNASLLTNAEKIATITTTHTPQQQQSASEPR